MKNMKWQALLLTLLIIALITGCTGTTPAKKEEQTEETTTIQDQTTHTNEYGWEVPKETLKFTVYAGTGDQTERDKQAAPMKQFYKDKFNVDIDIVVYSLDMTEQLNLMLASNNYPEVITWMPDDMSEKFIAQKRAWDLTEAIDKYGANIKRRLGKYLNLLRSADNSIKKLPIGWGKTPNVAGYDFACRYDLWKETGLPMYKTLDDYYNVLKTIVAKKPTLESGEKVYAISDNSGGTNIMNAMLAAYGYKNGFKVDKATGEFTYWINTPEGIEIVEYINRFYRDGLIDPDFLNNSYEIMLTKMFTEKVIGNIGVWWHSWTGGHEKWGVEDPNYTIEKRFMNATVEVPGVSEPTYLGSNFIGSSRFIITNKVKDKALMENIIKFVDWEYTELGNLIVGNGYPDPGNIWDIIDGKWIYKDNTFDNATKNENVHAVKEKYGSGQVWLATSGGWIEDDRIDPRVTRVSAYDFWPINEKGEFLDEGVRICWSNVKAEPWDSTLFQVTFPGNDPISQINQTIKDTVKTEFAKIITANSHDEMVRLYNEAKNRLNSLGLEELTLYNQEQYRLNAEKIK